jgi:TolA-binding protein
MAKTSQEFVAVIAHNRPNHGEGEHIVQGKKKHLCNIYDVSSCKAHENMSSALQQKNLLKGVRGTPTHITFDPHTLEEISRAHFMSASQIEDTIKEAQKKLGKPVTYKDFSKMKDALDEARAKLSEKDYRAAFKALKGYKSKGMKSLDAEAKAINDELMAAGKELIANAKKALESGDKKEAQKLLREVTKGFGGTDLAKEAQKLLKEAKEE